jgi:two-component system LytT family response regulator
MNKIKTIIIDDEAPARALIKNYLEDFEDIDVAAEASNGFDGIKAIQEQQPDLLFLDIQMPKITGFELLELLDNPPVIIFSTAYDQYALKAFEKSAADYLLKPYSRERFREAVNRARLFVRNKTKHREVINGIVRSRDAQPEFLERVVVKEGAQIFVIPVDKLQWLEAQDDYVMLYLKDGQFLKQKTMKYFEEHLNPKDFVRIHRSFIVRMAMIKQIELSGKESYTVVLTNGQRLPVSKSGHARLKEMLR